MTTRVDCGTQHHFVGKCDFHLSTFVGSLLVSTVGEYRDERKEMQRLAGADNSFFETMVFRTDGTPNSYGHPTVENWLGRTLSYYDTAAKANAGHASAVRLLLAKGLSE